MFPDPTLKEGKGLVYIDTRISLDVDQTLSLLDVGSGNETKLVRAIALNYY